MKKRYLKTLVFMLIVMIIIGILLLSALFRNGDLIDRSIIFDTPQIIFILSSGFVLVGSLIFIIHGLNKQRSILQTNLNINKLNEIKETGK